MITTPKKMVIMLLFISDMIEPMIVFNEWSMIFFPCLVTWVV